MALVRRAAESMLSLKDGEVRPSKEARRLIYTGPYYLKGDRTDLAELTSTELADEGVVKRMKRIERVAGTAKVLLAVGSILASQAVLDRFEPTLILRMEDGDGIEVCNGFDLDGTETLTPETPTDSGDKSFYCEIGGVAYRIGNG